MPIDFAAAMRRAAQATRASSLTEATRIIRDALSGREPQAEPSDAGSVSRQKAADAEAPQRGAGTPPLHDRLKKPLGEALGILKEGRLKTAPNLRPSGLTGLHTPGAPVPVDPRIRSRTFSCAAGSRDYRLYVPDTATSKGLIVMLHGCKQDPDDFAAGTAMNQVAGAQGWLVAYPGQPRSANPSGCWNWFNPADQNRDAGEPAIIAGITREIMTEFGVAPGRVFVAGLSAGGAMAAVMGATYPELYSAVGIHSGLPYRSANDAMSAFAAMRGDAVAGSRAAQVATPGPRTIVFHGSSDHTVHPSNADRIVAAATPDAAASTSKQGTEGRAYTTTRITDRDGRTVVENWLVEGAGHAWSGGRAGGSFVDLKGPDASAEMLRFFAEG